jgi:hypothetical protein
MCDFLVEMAISDTFFKFWPWQNVPTLCWKAIKTCPQDRLKNTRCKGLHVIERLDHSYYIFYSSYLYPLLLLLYGKFQMLRPQFYLQSPLKIFNFVIFCNIWISSILKIHAVNMLGCLYWFFLSLQNPPQYVLWPAAFSTCLVTQELHP